MCAAFSAHQAKVGVPIAPPPTAYSSATPDQVGLVILLPTHCRESRAIPTHHPLDIVRYCKTLLYIVIYCYILLDIVKHC